MSKAKRKPTAPNKPPKGWWASAGITLVITIAIVAMINLPRETDNPASAPATNPPPPVPPSLSAPTQAVVTPPAATNDPTAMEAAQSLVVTEDLDFGGARPNLAQAIQQIDRRSIPEDGQGRTFAILEAFNGEYQPDGRMRISLRISTEKPGVAQILFRGPGQEKELWKSRVKPATHKPPFAAGQLTILFDNGDGKTFTVDGSTGPATILDAMLKEPGLPMSQVWPDGMERELSFIYSACGCPIKVTCRRVGSRTERTKPDSQVLFPDDPAAMQVISRLMGW